MKNILFVCTGNICRSPMAEGIFNSMIRKAGKENLFISSSAGVYAMVAQNASAHSVSSLKDMDIDISNHKAQNVTEDLLEQSHIIITMTREHKNLLIRRFSSSTDKIFTFHEFAHDDIARNVEDPYGLDIKDYEMCANEILDGMEKILDRVVKNNSGVNE